MAMQRIRSETQFIVRVEYKNWVKTGDVMCSFFLVLVVLFCDGLFKEHFRLKIRIMDRPPESRRLNFYDAS